MFDLMIKDDDPRLVARRGRPFVLELILNRPYNKETDVISFIFTHERNYVKLIINIFKDLLIH